MNTTIHPAFGYLILKQQIPANTVISDDSAIDGIYTVTDVSKFGQTTDGFIWLYVSGQTKVTNIYTGEIQLRNPGYCNLVTSETIGTFRHEILEDSVIFCMSGRINTKRLPLPVLQYFSLSADAKAELPPNTKLFLADGSITVGEQTFTGPKQIKVGGATREAIAKTQCYGYVFP
jgi:hypothetical protein